MAIKSDLLYAIVKFPLEENHRALVPLSWINEKEEICFYPPKHMYNKMEALIKKQTTPSDEWALCKAIVIRKYGSYASGRSDLPRSEETSNLESEEENGTKRKRKVNRFLSYPGESSEEEEVCSNTYPFPTLGTFGDQSNLLSSSKTCHKSKNVSKSPVPTLKITTYQHTSLSSSSKVGHIAKNVSESPVPTLQITTDQTTSSLSSSKVGHIAKKVSSPLSNDNLSSPTLEAFSPSEPHSSHHTLGLATILTNTNQTSSKLSANSSPSNFSSKLSSISSHSKLSTPSSSRRCQITNDQLYEAILRLQSSVADMHHSLNEISERISMLEQKNTETQVRQSEEDVDQMFLIRSLPLMSMEDFDCLNDKLNGNIGLQNKLVKLLVTFGGKNAKYLTMNIMKRTVGDEVAKNFSFTGKKGVKEEKTRAFINTAICKVIHAAVQKEYKGVQTSDVIKQQMMCYLNQAQTRLNRREQKEKENASQANQELNESAQ